MIERYTIKFGPAVSQKEFDDGTYNPDDFTKMKVRIELICEPADIKKLSDLLKELSRKE